VDDREARLPARRPLPLGQRLRAPDSYGLLLILVLSSLLLIAIVGDRLWGQMLVTAVSGVTALFAFWTSRPRTRVLRFATILVTLSVVGASLAVLGSGTALDTMSRVGVAVVTAASPVVVARRLLRHPRVQGSTILGALCIYLLLGQFFAYLFATIGAMSPPFFATEAHPTIVDYLYFSYTSLTTVGYGDLTAGKDIGRMLAVCEALVGQLYLVTVVALLVSNVGRGRAAR
jgi:hypothetical protein